MQVITSFWLFFYSYYHNQFWISHIYWDSVTCNEFRFYVSERPRREETEFLLLKLAGKWHQPSCITLLQMDFSFNKPHALHYKVLLFLIVGTPGKSEHFHPPLSHLNTFHPTRAWERPFLPSPKTCSYKQLFNLCEQWQQSSWTGGSWRGLPTSSRPFPGTGRTTQVWCPGLSADVKNRCRGMGRLSRLR